MDAYVWSEPCSVCHRTMFSMNNWKNGEPVCQKCTNKEAES